eukprot:TRINITY_DN0_c1_g1_i1.p1 TRINITY_DN0_c1_g1~~TRINITY_DN0_c1_g1_i1.p1  ORF type:complete len:297 (-),score=86.34 TRINITY_DN0_c1_g1_i1:133-1023(-)
MTDRIEDNAPAATEEKAAVSELENGVKKVDITDKPAAEADGASDGAAAAAANDDTAKAEDVKDESADVAEKKDVVAKEGEEKDDDKKEGGEEGEAAVGSTTCIVDPSNFQVKHPLQSSWTIWYDNPGKKTSQQSWGDHLKQIISFNTVEDFWGIYNNIAKCSVLQQGSNYHIFKEGIQPKWEDPVNSKGGKWVLMVPTRERKSKLDELWLWTMLAVVGEQFAEGDEICGAVVSLRKGQDKISLWIRSTPQCESTKSIGHDFKRTLDLDRATKIVYTSHSQSVRRGSSYNNKSILEL